MFRRYFIWKIILKLNSEAMDPGDMVIQNSTK